MDRLEEFIKSHRSELDMLEPPQGLERKLSKGGRREVKLYHYLAIAASVLIIFSTSLIFIISGRKYDSINNTANSSDASPAFKPGIREMEIYYNNVINNLYNEAKPMLTKQPELESELKLDISKLDSICIAIKRDLKDNVANGDVVEALIINYRMRIRILEDMLSVLKEDENTTVKSKKHEI